MVTKLHDINYVYSEISAHLHVYTTLKKNGEDISNRAHVNGMLCFNLTAFVLPFIVGSTKMINMWYA